MAVDSSAPERSSRDDPPYARVKDAARGQRKDYRLERVPIAQGGQAVVFRGVHKATQVPVAFKKLVAHNSSAVARMRREIEASRRFGDHPHVMPLLDADARNSWFVMPLADATASTLAGELADPARLRELVTAVCLALREPHRLGWVHRDLKPDNILMLDGRWTVADWGLGRRPRGQTSDPRRTAAGAQFGTIGFAAPELAVDAHGSGPQADVYSIGQLIGWALTAQWPQANIPLLPEPGPWRRIVQDATAFGVNQHRRPADAPALLALVTAELDAPTDSAVDRAKRLLADANTAGALLGLAADAGPDRAFFEQVLSTLDEEQLSAAVKADPAAAQQVLHAVRAWPGEEPIGLWLLEVARIAESLAEWDVLREAAEGVVRLNRPENAVRDWLTSVDGEAASAVAAALRGHADAFRHLVGTSGLDHRIVNALRARPRPGAPATADETSEERPGWLRRRWKAVAVAASVAAAGVVVPIVLNQQPGTQNAVEPPKVPSKAADSPQMANHVRAWDAYPTWLECTTDATKGAVVNGGFPLARQAPAPSAYRAFLCSTGSNLKLLVGDYASSPRDYDDALAHYRQGQPPRVPVETEASAPEEVFLFQWDDTHRALMWTSAPLRTIGIITTDSPSTSLVDLWKTYQQGH